MKTTYKEPYEFLRQHKLAVLSTAADKDVWGAAIYYAINDTLAFYFFTKTNSKKYQLILKNPHVAITVADDEAQTTVQAAGRVEELSIGEELNEAYRKLVQIHPPGEISWKPPVSKLNDDGQTIVLKLQPTILQFAEFKSDSRLTDDHIRRVI